MSKKYRRRNKTKNRIVADILKNFSDDNLLIASIWVNGKWEKYFELDLQDLARNKVYTPLRIEVEFEIDLGRDRFQFDIVQKYYIL